MEKKISQDDERRLTAAIEKAASLASADDSRDRSSLLASCLLDSGIDSKFAKVASAAFNKRLTVLTFQKTADEHKGEPFPLSDSDAVFAYMGGVPQGQVKTASVARATFSISMSGRPLEKKASAPARPVRVNYEDRVMPDVLERHVDGLLQKQAAAYSRLHGTLCTLEAELESGRMELAGRLSKCASFDFHVLCNSYGDDLAGLMQDEMPVTDFRKTASGSIRPSNATTRLIDSLLVKKAAAEDLRVALCAYERGLDQLLTGASALGRELHKTAGVGPLIRGVMAVAGTGMQGGLGIGGALRDSALVGFDNAAQLIGKGDYGTRPEKVLDADFLIRDRFRDRLMSWSDMSADPLLSMYPAEQVFLATQKAMDLDTTLERPDRREVLRAQVAQLLAQNNRLSNADVAAAATILRGLGGAGQSASEKSYQAAAALDKEVPPDAPVFANMLTYQSQTPGRDYFKDMAEANKAEADSDSKKKVDARSAQIQLAAKAAQAVIKDNKVSPTANPDVFNAVDSHGKPVQLTRMQLRDMINAQVSLASI